MNNEINKKEIIAGFVVAAFLGIVLTAAFIAVNKISGCTALSPVPPSVSVVKNVDVKLVQTWFNEDLTNAELIDKIYAAYPALKPALDIYAENTAQNRNAIADFVFGDGRQQKADGSSQVILDN